MNELTSRPQRSPLVEPGQIEHHVNDLTVTASADLTLAQLQDRLAEHDQWLPIDGDPNLPLRELVQKNSTGPLRLGFGAWRDLLLGVQFMTPGGSLITAGARTMKNVAGYDLTKFMVGQYGVFGRLITITTRTYKRPAGAILAQMPYSHESLSQLLIADCRPHWAMLHDGRLYCGYLGDDASLGFYESALSQQGATQITRTNLADDISFRSSRWLSGRRPIVFRASVPPAKVGQFMAKVDDPTRSADPVFGIVVGSCASDSAAQDLDEHAAKLGGSIVFDEPNRIANFFQSRGPVRELLKRLESAFEQ